MRSLALAAALISTSACGAASDARERAPAERIDPPRLAAGELPGPRPPGTYRDEHGRSLADVHELMAAGRGTRRVALLVARGQGGVVCHGLRLGDGREGELDCLETWENPPLVLRVAVGGENEASTDWLVAGGLVRGPAERVVVQPQSGAEEPLALREWPRFAWRGFLTASGRRNLANTLTVLDGEGEPVTRVELSWAYDPPCRQGNEDVCAGSPPPRGAWAEARDPVAAAQGASNEERAKWLAFRDPAVRRLVDGRVFALGPTAGWQKCSGEDFGAVVALRLHPPADFEGEIPIHGYAEDDEPVAYRTGRARVVARNVTAVEVWVDLRAGRVVGIELDAFDEVDDLGESAARIDEREIVEEPRPAGGSDDPDACPEHEVGD